MKTLITVLIFLSVSTAFSQWVQTSGPGGITINALLKNGSVMLAGSETYGVYRSTNNGSSWLTTTGTSNARVRAFVYLKCFYFCGVSGPGSLKGIYKSSDNGQSWQLMSSTMSGKFINSLAVKDNLIFPGTPYPDGGLFRSSDGGQSWTNLVPNSISRVNFLFVNGDAILLGSDNFIWRSVNNGDSWSLVYHYVLSGIYSM